MNFGEMLCRKKEIFIKRTGMWIKRGDLKIQNHEVKTWGPAKRKASFSLSGNGQIGNSCNIHQWGAE
jgi:hypothetical protein